MKHNTRQLLIRLAAAPFQCSVCLRNRKSRQERFLNIRAGYIFIKDMAGDFLPLI